MASRKGKLAAPGVSRVGAPDGSPGEEIQPEKAVFERPTFEGLWSVYECAEFLAYSPQSLWALLQRGDGPPAFWIGNRRGIRFRPAEVRKWLETRRIGKTEGEK